MGFGNKQVCDAGRNVKQKYISYEIYEALLES